ncbi:hypothetical protein SSP531S_23070 [Streptomyces spongiicola]|uniref:Uncharacterized protein n=1 Tax=Streptomyces spongiicola TaxID=1690221 RepID=A0A388SXX2_9ACTN|nr:hypothetical protein SSP531S_23070 [Streptomyces spongiicola]
MLPLRVVPPPGVLDTAGAAGAAGVAGVAGVAGAARLPGLRLRLPAPGAVASAGRLPPMGSAEGFPPTAPTTARVPSHDRGSGAGAGVVERTGTVALKRTGAVEPP